MPARMHVLFGLALQCQPAVHAACHRQTAGNARAQVGNDVVLRLEFIRDRQMKGALIGIWVVESLAFVALIADISLKLSKVRALHWTQCQQPAATAACMAPCAAMPLCRQRHMQRRLLKRLRTHAAAWRTRGSSAGLTLLLRRSQGFGSSMPLRRDETSTLERTLLT